MKSLIATLSLLLFAVAGFSPVTARAAAATNAAPAARPQIWDAAEALELSSQQREKLAQLKAEYDRRRAEHSQQLRDTTLSDEARAAARAAYREFFVESNRRIGELLTEAQRKKFSDLVRAYTESLPNRTAAVPRRPDLNDAEAARVAAELRAVYSQSPDRWPKAVVDAGVEFEELTPAAPARYTPPADTNLVALGKALFFDPRLSGSGQIACASCHDPDLAWGDGRTVSFGHGRKELKRNAPSLLNAAARPALFWDGRAPSLEAQARAVLLNPDEMRSSESLVAERLGAEPGYREWFRQSFTNEAITLDRVTTAIAAFERTIVSRANAFDSFLRGKTNALSDAAVRGLHLFRTEARCVNCHHGPTLSDGKFHDLGLSYYGRKFEDLGRYHVTRDAADVGRFKTPSLRNVGITGPYMHNGLFSLEGVLNLYNAGMPTLRRKENELDDPLFPTKSPLLKPLGLNARDLADLKEFLLALNESPLRVRPPALPGLTSVESNPPPDDP